MSLKSISSQLGFLSELCDNSVSDGKVLERHWLFLASPTFPSVPVSNRKISPSFVVWELVGDETIHRVRYSKWLRMCEYVSISR